jgi:beta-glucosidase
LSMNAGLDMDMVGEGFLTTLGASLKEKKVTQARIDEACRKILEAKYRLGLFEDPFRYIDENRAKTEVFSAANRKEARAIAAQSFVLLKNVNQLLPLKKSGAIALIGPLADNKENMGGTWSVAANLSKATSLLQAFKETIGNQVAIHYAKGSNLDADAKFEERAGMFGKSLKRDNRTDDQLLNEALDAAAKSDVIVVAAGESAEMSGEASSRSNLDIPGVQKNLIKALLKTGKPVVLVLFTGRPLTLTWENEQVPAILNVWFPGSEGPYAIADVLFGEVNPSGKLSATFPQNVGQVPLFYNHKNTGRPLRGPWFQKFQSNYLDVSNDPLYPFGYGLSYTNFNYSDLSVSHTKAKGNQSVTASVTLTNTGSYEGKEVVQLYIRDMVGSITRPVTELKGFQKVSLKPGESQKVSFTITPEDLKFYNYDLKYDWEAGDFEIMIGTNSQSVKKANINWTK